MSDIFSAPAVAALLQVIIIDAGPPISDWRSFSTWPAT